MLPLHADGVQRVPQGRGPVCVRHLPPVRDDRAESMQEVPYGSSSRSCVLSTSGDAMSDVKRIERIKELLGKAVVSMGGNEGEHVTLSCLESQYRELYELASDYDALRQQLDLHKKAHVMCEAGDPLDAVEQLMESERLLKQQLEQAQAWLSCSSLSNWNGTYCGECVVCVKTQLAQAQARVGAIDEVPSKYDVSITYRQHEKKWLVRYISWGQDQKMFVGESENLMEAVDVAKQQAVASQGQQGGGGMSDRYIMSDKELIDAAALVEAHHKEGPSTVGEAALTVSLAHALSTIAYLKSTPTPSLREALEKVRMLIDQLAIPIGCPTELNQRAEWLLRIIDAALAQQPKVPVKNEKDKQ